MNKEIDRRGSEVLPDESELMGLVELQKFLADELAEADLTGQYSRAFLPLTNGLGLDSPPERDRRKEAPGGDRRREAEARRNAGVRPGNRPLRDDRPVREPILFADPQSSPRVAPPRREWSPEEVRPRVQARTSEPMKPASGRVESILGGEGPDEDIAELRPSRPRAQRPLSDVIGEGSAEAIPVERPLVTPASAPEAPKEAPVMVTPQVGASAETVAPPPVPKPTFFRRLSAGIVDQIFVWTVFGVALAITGQALSAGSIASVNDLVAQLSRPVFLRFAALEFATIWLCYLFICLGLLDMTFGMWVWGLRVGYPADTGASRFLRKVMRIFCSFLFFAPLAPSLVLALRYRGRNLLDGLSGSHLYRTGV